MISFGGKRSARNLELSWEAAKSATVSGRKASRAQRAVAEDALEELGQEEEHAVHAGDEEEPCDVGRGAVAVRRTAGAV